MMNMQNIPVGLDDKTIAKLDALVKLGIYKNRTEAIRAQILEGLSKKPYVMKILDKDRQEKIDEAVRWMFERDHPLLRLKTSQTIASLVSEDRDR